MSHQIDFISTVGRQAVFEGLAPNRYRYRLIIPWGDPCNRCMFVMLNPSTADATHDDATIRRCRSFAEAMGHEAIDVVNLFGLCSTDPRELKRALAEGRDPIGPKNDGHIVEAMATARTIVCAWGTHGGLLGRDRQVRALLETGQRFAKAPPIVRLPKALTPVPWI